MPCLLALLAVFFPRVVIVLIFVFSQYLNSAYDTVLWPVLGFIFMPFTTLAYAFAVNNTGGNVAGVYLAVVVIAVLMDLGSWSGGATARRRW
ncbi:hypothetical protein ACERK3_04065 [Phycisphaerales bacterium AB-hyl4]|uniref:Uncharacterized protein n=1 Tax=Natronomicrosphaera hydrolytica TaxID=3242702 RepID=A0ABV4U1I6_9BACT